MIAEATQYYETLAIEKDIESNPEVREAWLSRQLEAIPTAVVFEDEGGAKKMRRWMDKRWSRLGRRQC